MKVDAPCPECGHTPVDVLNMLDGSAWICPACGHREYEEANEAAGEEADLIASEHRE
ncbi:MAG: hypothetical protein KDI35_00680 [Gammaproteobacteria bacterium]|nr:hypothetical protein [Gammaproteobacteria bacterium]